MRDMDERLRDPAPVLMDGATGTEICRRGLALDDRAWSALAHWQHPDLVRGVHRDYLLAGADIVTANTFAASKHVLATVGLEDDFRDINEAAVRVAREACAEAGRPDALVAGSLSTLPPLHEPGCVPVGPAVAANHREQAAVLRDAGVDLLIAEMMMDADATNAVLDACHATGLPVWLGLSASRAGADGPLTAYRPPGKYRDMAVESFDHLCAAVVDSRVSVAGVMHTRVDVTPEALRCLRRHWDGPLLAYAETGRFLDPDWDFSEAIAPDDYAAEVARWVAGEGVRVVGGCCGTGPAHVAAIAAACRAATPA